MRRLPLQARITRGGGASERGRQQSGSGLGGRLALCRHCTQAAPCDPPTFSSSPSSCYCLPAACRHWQQLAPNGEIPSERVHRSKQVRTFKHVHLMTIWCSQGPWRRNAAQLYTFPNARPLESLVSVKIQHQTGNWRVHLKPAPHPHFWSGYQRCWGTGSTCSDMLWLIAASLVAAALTVMIAKLALLPRSLAARAPGPAHSTAGARTPLPPGAARCVRNHRRAAICVLGQRNRTAT